MLYNNHQWRNVAAVVLKFRFEVTLFVKTFLSSSFSSVCSFKSFYYIFKTFFNQWVLYYYSSKNTHIWLYLNTFFFMLTCNIYRFQKRTMPTFWNVRCQHFSLATGMYIHHVTYWTLVRAFLTWRVKMFHKWTRILSIGLTHARCRIHTFNYMQSLQHSCTTEVHFLCAWEAFQTGARM